MVTRLRYMSTDPDHKGRGPGLYYLRHHKRGRPVHSKFTEHKDGVTFRNPIKPGDVGASNIQEAEEKFSHVGDFKTVPNENNERSIRPRKAGSMRGFF